MNRRRWPSATEYVAAVKDAPSSFRVGPLAQATYATAGLIPGMDDEPAIASGQNAVVFEADVTGYRQAVRCFTTAPVDGHLRYAELAKHLRTSPVAAIASAHWVEDAVEVGGDVFPLVTMEWVDGTPMNLWVEQHLNDREALFAFAERWSALCTSLRSASVAHGDLQHGNVLVDDAGRPRLIDLDGVWVPGVVDHPPTEVGHPNYQHPDRLTEGTWGEHIDWFSALVVHVSILALASEPSLWRFHTGENLLFTRDDLLDTDREVWAALRWSDDLEVRRLVSVLATALDVDAGSPLDLATVLRQGVRGGQRRTVTEQPSRRETASTSWENTAREPSPPQTDAGAAGFFGTPADGFFDDLFGSSFGATAAGAAPGTETAPSTSGHGQGAATNPSGPNATRPPKPGATTAGPAATTAGSGPSATRPPKPGASTASSAGPQPRSASTRPPKPGGGVRAPGSPPPNAAPAAPAGQRPPKPPPSGGSSSALRVFLSVLLLIVAFVGAGMLGPAPVIGVVLIVGAVAGMFAARASG